MYMKRVIAIILSVFCITSACLAEAVYSVEFIGGGTAVITEHDDHDVVPAFEWHVVPHITSMDMNTDHANARMIIPTKEEMADILDVLVDSSYFWVEYHPEFSIPWPLEDVELVSQIQCLTSLTVPVIGLMETRLISICYVNYTNTGGAHGISSMKTVNIDLGHPYGYFSLYNYVNEPFEFRKAVAAILEAAMDETGDYYYDAYIYVLESSLDNAYFTEEGMVLPFNQGDIAAMVYGLQFLHVPYADIIPFLNEEGLEVFAFTGQTASVLGDQFIKYPSINGGGDTPGYRFISADESYFGFPINQEAITELHVTLEEPAW